MADYSKMKAAGYDYAELDMPELEAMSDRDFGAFQEQVSREGLPILTGARILPIAEPMFFLEGFQPASLEDYLHRTCRRSAALGIGKIILGNGKARTMTTPEDRKKEPVFIQLLRMLGEIAGENGQELILEPLGPKYSNYINTIPEAVRVLEAVGLPNVYTMADLRHVVWSEESFQDLVDYGWYIHHIHVDYPLSYPERGYPQAEDGYHYGAFLEALQQSQCCDTLTIEADVPQDWGLAHQRAVDILRPILD